jgi:ribose/xylose/arabinose/galactoside ABC-type transport system permease subunit
MKLPRIDLKVLAIATCISVAIGSLVSWLSGMPIWAASLIVAGAMLVNGLIAEVEDQAPRGFLKPTGKKK